MRAYLLLKKSRNVSKTPLKPYGYRWLIGLFFFCSLSACSQHGPHPDDPYEAFNRKMFAVNEVLDKAVLKPTASIYRRILPWPFRLATSHVFQHILTLPVIANDILQAKFTQAASDIARFLVNSSFGFAGVIDVAKEWGLRQHHNDFGMTLAHYGNHHSAYLVLPLLGPSTVRDGYGSLLDFSLFTVAPWVFADCYIWAATAWYYIDVRANLLDNGKVIQQATLDPYVFQRDAYLQHRRYLLGQQASIEDDGYIEE